MAVNGSLPFLWGNITSVEQSASQVYGNIILSLIILLVGFIIAKLVSKVLYRVLSDINLNEALAKVTHAQVGFVEVIGTIAYLAIIIASIYFALKQLDLTRAVFGIMVLISSLLILLSVAVAIIDVFPNLAAGILLLRRRIVRKGDEILFKGTHGKVVELSLLDTRMQDDDGNLVVIPNSAFSKSEIKVLAKRKVQKEGS